MKSPAAHGRLAALAASTLLSLVLSGFGAQAQEGDADYERGLDALYRGELPTALQAFQDSLARDPRPDTWRQLGTTYVRLEQPQQAYQAFDTFLTLADPVSSASDILQVQSEIARLRATSTVLVLAITPKDAQLQIDGSSVSPRHGQILLTPGAHAITVSAPGFVKNIQTDNLPAGRFLYTLELQTTTNLDAASAQNIAQPTRNEPDRSIAQSSAEDSGQAEKETTNAQPSTCLLHPTCVGLVASLGAPNALGLGALARLDDYWAFSLDAHLLPTMKISGTKVHAQLFVASAHVHPFASGWFLSVGLGLQRLLARAERPAAVVDAKVNIPVLALGLGYMGRSGWVAGIDLSLLVPLQPTRLRLLNQPKDQKEAALYQRLTQEANDAVDSLQHLLPVMFQLNLLRVGYVF